MSGSSETGEVVLDQEALLAEVQSAWEPREALVVLAQLGIDDQDIAIATDTNPQTPGRWRSTQTPARRQADKIDQVRSIVARLLVDGTVRLGKIASWLRVRHLQLDDRKPLELIRDDRYDEVVDFVRKLGTPVGADERADTE